MPTTAMTGRPLISGRADCSAQCGDLPPHSRKLRLGRAPWGIRIWGVLSSVSTRPSACLKVSGSSTRAVTAAAGVYAPGHLGGLTPYLPFELVDDVLEQTRTVQRRLRALPSRTGVYFLLALAMFPRLGYARVWAKLTAGLAGLDVPSPSEKALRDLRRRLGPAPVKALFEVVAGPLARPRTPGVCFAGLRTVAFDGLNSLKVPDTGPNRCWIGRIRYRMGFAGYPTLRLMALAETGTRGLLGAVLGSAGDRDEAYLARRLLHLLRPGMLLLLDRAFDANTFLAEVHATGAMLLARARSARNPRCRFSSLLAPATGLTWPDADCLIDLAPDLSHRSVTFLMARHPWKRRRSRTLWPVSALRWPRGLRMVTAAVAQVRHWLRRR